jgi:hypothetical protein
MKGRKHKHKNVNQTEIDADVNNYGFTFLCKNIQTEIHKYIKPAAATSRRKKFIK